MYLDVPSVYIETWYLSCRDMVLAVPENLLTNETPLDFSRGGVACGVSPLPDNRCIGDRADLGHLYSGQDDQHREGDRGRGREDGTNLEVPSRPQVGFHENPEHLRGGAYGGTNDLHVLTP